MRDIQTDIPNINLTAPNPERDAPFALTWFASKFGKETLLLMGNAEHEIKPASIESETKIIEEFIGLAEENKQLTWMIRDQNKTIGATWIELVDAAEVKSPAIHIMIGDKEYRGQGIGRAVINEMIRYSKTDLEANDIYSRHLADNHVAEKLLALFGFNKEGEVYIDKNNLSWQNVHLHV